MSRTPRLLHDPHLAHERLAAREYGAKSTREIDEDNRAQADLVRLPVADRIRISGNLRDGSALRELIHAFGVNGFSIDDTTDDPDTPPIYENNAGPLYRGTKPSIAAGAAAGTTPTLSISEGTDHVGRITLVVGSAPATGLLATITMHVPLPTAAYAVRLSPADASAATVAGRSVYCDFATQDADSWELYCQTVLVAGTSYHWWYALVPFIEL